MTVREIAIGVMAHAIKNYSDGTGWDEIVECFSVDELSQSWLSIGYNPQSVSGAIAHQARTNKIRKSYADDIRAG